MNIVITGGTGLIGRALSNKLIKQGHSVTILSRSGAKGKNTGELKYLVWNGETPGEWESALASSNVIINLAGENIGAGKWTDERKTSIRESRVKAGKALVQAVLHGTHKPDLFIQASAVGCYGTHDETEFDESSPFGNDYLSQVAKEWEESTLDIELGGIPRAIIRTGVVLDRIEGALPRMVLPFMLFSGGPLGSGKQWISWIHLEDEVNAIIHIINHHLRGVYNLTAPEPIRNKDFGKILGRVLKRPYWFPVPAFALKLALGEMSTLVLDGQKVLPRRLSLTGFEFQYPKAELALQSILGKSK